MSLRNIFQKFICLSILLILIGSAHATTTATIHGAVYEWTTFEPLENVIIEVNSTPPQSIVAKYGIYSFDLAPGDYTITARYYQDGTLLYSTQETITITDNGDYVLDLLLLPTYSEELLEDSEFDNISESFEEDSKIIEGDSGTSTTTYLLAAALVIIIAASAYLLVQRRGKEEDTGQIAVLPPEEVEEDITREEFEKEQSLPADLQEIIDIIEANGGRITQKELRSRVRYSEAKVSLMISDLENRGIVEKFKKGRGNIIIIVESEN